MLATGILNPSSSDPWTVTGTRLFDPPHKVDQSLKRHPKKPEIILQPQPSDDPNDPLNWSPLVKELFFATLILSTSAVGVAGPLFIPAFTQMSVEFGVEVTKISQLNGILVMFIGIASFLGIVGSGFVGKRPILLGTMILYVAGVAWAATSKSYGSLYGARILQGLGIGAFACEGNVLVGDVFFLHELGIRTSVWQLAWVVTTSMTPLLSARIISASGWRTAFHGLLGFSAFCLVLIILAMPESTYIRSVIVEHVSSTDHIGPASQGDKDIDVKAISFPVTPDLEEHTTRSPWAKFLPCAGIYKMDSVALTFLRPFFVMFTPNVLWATVTYSWLFTVNILFGAVYSQIFGSAPYNLSVSTVGNISGVPPLIGSLVACLLAGPMADYTARYLSRRNNGFFEPEMYLVLMIPCSILSLAGLLGWGYSVQQALNQNVAALFIGVTLCGLTFGFIGTILYSTSVFPVRGGDAFGIIMLVKSGMAFGCIYIVNDWLVLKGPVAFFGTIAGTGVGLSVLALPMYVYGKRLRRWTSESRALGWTTR